MHLLQSFSCHRVPPGWEEFQLPGGHRLVPGTIEAETLVQHGSWFIVLAVHGNRDSRSYSTGWSKSQHIRAWPDNGGTTLLTSAGTGLCGPGDGDVAASQADGQDRISFDSLAPESNSVISTPRLASDSFTPVIGEYPRQ
jgi:hypothetical protein